MKQAKSFNIEGMSDNDIERHTIYETKLLDYFQNLRFFSRTLTFVKFFFFSLFLG
jgi:hypothetical protein